MLIGWPVMSRLQRHVAGWEATDGNTTTPQDEGQAALDLVNSPMPPKAWDRETSDRHPARIRQPGRQSALYRNQSRRAARLNSTMSCTASGEKLRTGSRKPNWTSLAPGPVARGFTNWLRIMFSALATRSCAPARNGSGRHRTGQGSHGRPPFACDCSRSGPPLHRDTRRIQILLALAHPCATSSVSSPTIYVFHQFCQSFPTR